MADAIAAAQKAGILVVSAVGNRPPDETGTGPADPYKVGEKQVRFPATEKGVLGVTALDAGGDLDPTFVWTGPGTDVSAPAVKALSVTVGGAACGIVDVASSWATAQVSGLAALLFAEDATLTPAQVSTRIVATARGAVNDSALDGHGMIQPLEALTADLEIAEGRDAAPRAGVHRPARRGEGSRAAAGHLRGVPADDAVVGDRCRWGAAARPAAAAADRAPAYLSRIRGSQRGTGATSVRSRLCEGQVGSPPAPGAAASDPRDAFQSARLRPAHRLTDADEDVLLEAAR